jgi:hypothetical protein
VFSLLLELTENLIDISSMSKAEHDFKLGELDIDRIIVFAEEHFHVVLEHIWSLLNDK